MKVAIYAADPNPSNWTWETDEEGVMRPIKKPVGSELGRDHHEDGVSDPTAKAKE